MNIGIYFNITDKNWTKEVFTGVYFILFFYFYLSIILKLDVNFYLFNFKKKQKIFYHFIPIPYILTI